jgi:hypothetical protein
MSALGQKRTFVLPPQPGLRQKLCMNTGGAEVRV